MKLTIALICHTVVVLRQLLVSLVAVMQLLTKIFSTLERLE
jgi:hypothetical protein